jgi:histidine triad (HIT) family protein
MGTVSDCLFCKIIAKQIPSNPVTENEDLIAIRDINPQAPTHILIIPKHHAKDITEMSDAALTGRLFAAAKSIAQSEGLTNGFRLVVNTGSDGGQTVDHLHIHLLGGRGLGWPPG